MLTEYYMHIEPGITSESEVKFVHGFRTTLRKLVLLVDLAML